MLRYRIGGTARYFCAVKTVRELIHALKEAKKHKLQVFILGGGTNLLMRDEEFPGVVLQICIGDVKRVGNHIVAGAGLDMSDLLSFSAHEGLSGLEWAGGLPGTFGGAIRGNAGAFGGETKDAVVMVTALDTRTLRLKRFTNKECGFGYRSSIFKVREGCYVIVSATLSLKKGNAKDIRAAIREKIDHRASRHPMEYPNIGSIFKNVPWERIPKKHQGRFEPKLKTDPMPVLPTASLIGAAGLKGISCGGAMISPKHANFIVNVCDASAADVYALIVLVKREVKRKYGVDLEPEVILV